MINDYHYLISDNHNGYHYDDSKENEPVNITVILSLLLY